MLKFPSNFIWGSATAAFQVEGGAWEDGRGESIWDRFCRTPGKVLNGDTGDRSTDHYHRWRDDIRMMRDLGMQAYRFSVAWPRILPQGDGAVNEAGLAFYDQLVDALLEAGLTPFLTLYHWDLPQTLQDRQGGWASPAIVDQFVHYADIVSRALGDRVKYWTTFNEPHVVINHGYIHGEHAPGLQDPFIGAQAGHHLLLAHGHAVPVLRQNVGADAQVGIVYNFGPVDVIGDDPELHRRGRIADAKVNRWFEDPIFKGHYTPILLELPEYAALKIGPDDLKIISAPVDYMGINYYSRIVISGDPNQSENVPVNLEHTQIGEANRTAMGWEIYPEGLYRLLKWLHAEYPGTPLYITENGAAFDDELAADGRVHDERRVTYLRDHFKMSWKAIQEGVPLQGYFVWSLLDNFEWAYGYSRRFGIVYVDYETCERYPKDSAYYYQAIIKANGLDE